MDDQTQWVRDLMEDDAARVLRSVRPLAVPDPAGLEFLPAGSVVLMWYRGARYLCSAAHVAETPQVFYIGTMTGWREVEGDWQVNRVTKGRREDDRIDLAFKRVDAAFAESLDGCSFLTGDQQTTTETLDFGPPPKINQYLVVGFQNNRFKIQRFSQTIEPVAVNFATTIASLDAHASAKCDPNVNLVLDYDWKDVIGERGSQRSPNLDGISGGGIFRAHLLERGGERKPLTLVAITIEERRASRILLGTRIGVLHRLIDGHVKRSG